MYRIEFAPKESAETASVKVDVMGRFSADRESLARWAEQWRGRLEVVAIEATTGWRWIWRELSAPPKTERRQGPGTHRVAAREDL